MALSLEDLLEQPIERPNYAVGLFVACSVARFFGIKEFWALEFGVAEGHGLRLLRDHASMLSRHFGLAIHVAGLDLGSGLPRPHGARDHPEIWTEGDFSMANREQLTSEFGENLILGPIAETAPMLVGRVTSDRPVGFMAIDVDFYTSTRDTLNTVGHFDADLLLPVVSIYFDDIYGGARRIGGLLRCPKAGQLLAIDEFNVATESRCIAPTYPLLERYPVSRFNWVSRMYSLHVLDSARRQSGSRSASASMAEHGALPDHDW